MEIGDINFYQIAVALISFTMIYLGVEKYLKQESGQSLLKLFVRIIVWGGMAAVALFPRLTYNLAEFLGIEDNINAVVLTGFLLVFLIIFKILSVIERIEQDISVLTRKDAIKDIKKTK